MRFLLVLLLTVFFWSNVFGLPVESSKSLLRADKPNGQDEERGILKSIEMAVKTSYWASKEKPKKVVKQLLKLEGLTGTALTSNPKYKYYLKYLYKAEGIEMNKMVSEGVTPTTVWQRLELNKMSDLEREVSGRIPRYTRYVEKYDSKVYHNEIPAPLPATDDEMQVLVKVWAQKDRPESYVVQRLGMRGNNMRYSHVYHKMVKRYPTEAEMEGHSNYKYLKKFREERSEFFFR